MNELVAIGNAAVLTMLQNPRSSWRMADLNGGVNSQNALDLVQGFLPEYEKILYSERALRESVARAKSGEDFITVFVNVETAIERALEIKYAVRRRGLELGVRGGVSAGLSFGPVSTRTDQWGTEPYGDTQLLSSELGRNSHTPLEDGNFLLSDQAASMLEAGQRSRCDRGPEIQMRKLGKFQSWRYPWDDGAEAARTHQEPGHDI